MAAGGAPLSSARRQRRLRRAWIVLSAIWAVGLFAWVYVTTTRLEPGEVCYRIAWVRGEGLGAALEYIVDNDGIELCAGEAPGAIAPAGPTHARAVADLRRALGGGLVRALTVKLGRERKEIEAPDAAILDRLFDEARPIAAAGKRAHFVAKLWVVAFYAFVLPIALWWVGRPLVLFLAGLRRK